MTTQKLEEGTAKQGMMVEYKTQAGEQIKLTMQFVRDYLVSGRKEFVTAQEIIYYMGTCKARRLNPLVKDCYLVKYTANEPAAIITSVDYFRKNARKADDCKGWNCGIIIHHKKRPENPLEYREGTLLLDGEELVGGWCSAMPEGWVKPKLHTVNLDRYIKKTREGKTTQFWSEEKQPDMITKVAECQLLRQVWGEESTGMYAPEEMPSLDSVHMPDIPEEDKKSDRLKTQTEQKPPEKEQKEPENEQKEPEKQESGPPDEQTEPPPTEEPENDQTEPEPEMTSNGHMNPFDNYDKYKFMRKESDSLSTYYYKNFRMWDSATDKGKGQFIDKWKKTYREVDLPEKIRAEINGNGPEKKEKPDEPEKQDAGPDTPQDEPESENGEETKTYHDPDFVNELPQPLYEIYMKLANVLGCLPEEVNPGIVNSTLKTKYSHHWETARNDLKFGEVVSSPAAYDVWNQRIIELSLI
jgi:phage recombination protein Bet